MATTARQLFLPFAGMRPVGAATAPLFSRSTLSFAGLPTAASRRFFSFSSPLAPLSTPFYSRRITAGPGVSALSQQTRGMSGGHDEYPPELTRGAKDTLNIPVGGEGLYARGSGAGSPMLFVMQWDRPTWQPVWEDEHQVIPRDGFGVPAQIPPEVSQHIKHVYYVPPQFFPFLKKLADDTPSLQPFMYKLIKGDFTYDDYEEMFYKFAKPLKIYRNQIPMPYRTPEEMAREAEVAWEGAWLSYRQKVLASYNTAMFFREYLFGALIGVYCAFLFLDQHRQYRLDMKLFYLEAPEHKINWVVPRGDLV
ncbi:hypothetical protein TGARI_229920 [Toxoplasma gondii ARI]|uniref:Transmembrane protein n=1 Tax=Toxoplasma gondii ARI TaxID=1074872 RepID=A0A139Y505_TOXGO|nr:hypothetical protein TGARI_229920 [Toxoplasma gondii ARI]